MIVVDGLTVENGSTTFFDVDATTGRVTIPSAANNALVVGPPIVWQTAVADNSQMLLQRHLAGGDVSEYGLSAQVIADTFTPTTLKQKAAIIAQSLSNASGLCDTLGIVGQGFVNTGVANGRAWGGDFEAVLVNNTSDALLIGVESGVWNFGGTTPTDPDSQLVKTNHWLAAQGTSPITAAMIFANEPGAWHYGYFMRHIAAEFVRMQTPGAAGAIGLNMVNHANWGEAIRIPNNVALRGYSVDGLSVYDVAKIDASNQVVVGGSAQPLVVGSASGKIGFFGASPVTKRTGWGSPTGTAVRTAFDTSTVSTTWLAQRVKALIDDLKSLGVISA